MNHAVDLGMADKNIIETEEFAGQLMEMLNHSATMVMISIGHRLELFDKMARLSPISSQLLADTCHLNERYVREWLAALTCGGVIDYDAENKLYSLSQAKAGCLTRAATPDNLAVMAQLIPMMGTVHDRIIECFKSGEGLSYGDYPCFHTFMAEDSSQTVVAALFDHIIPLIPGLGLKLESGIDVMDAGCGRGLALLELAQAYPNSRFVGYDLCEEAFAPTQQKAAMLGITNLRFEALDLQYFDKEACFDLVTTFDAVHDQSDPAGLLARIAKALKPGGVYLMQDIGGSSYLEKNVDHPVAPLLYSVSCMHCTPVSLGQGGPGLGTMWGEELAMEMLQQAGFSKLQAHRLDHDPFNIYVVAECG